MRKLDEIPFEVTWAIIGGERFKEVYDPKSPSDMETWNRNNKDVAAVCLNIRMMFTDEEIEEFKKAKIALKGNFGRTVA
jgi:hypothetical protein